MPRQQRCKQRLRAKRAQERSGRQDARLEIRAEAAQMRTKLVKRYPVRRGSV